MEQAEIHKIEQAIQENPEKASLKSDLLKAQQKLTGLERQASSLGTETEESSVPK